MVKKAPACKIGDLADALKDLFHADNPVQVMGVRLGEKMHETLLTREESATAQDMGDFFRVPADVGGLNYAKYFSDGNGAIAGMQEYTSHNTHQLTAGELKDKLLRCRYVAEELRMWNKK
jgi:UDP-glucose 4-epimerase